MKSKIIKATQSPSKIWFIYDDDTSNVKYCDEEGKYSFTLEEKEFLQEAYCEKGTDQFKNWKFYALENYLKRGY